MDDLDNLVRNHLMTYLARDQLNWGDDRLIIKEREPDPNSRGLERLCVQSSSPGLESLGGRGETK